MVSFPVAPRAGARHSISTASCPATGLRAVSVHGRAGRREERQPRLQQGRNGRGLALDEGGVAELGWRVDLQLVGDIEIVHDQAARKAVGRRRGRRGS